MSVVVKVQLRIVFAHVCVGWMQKRKDARVAEKKEKKRGSYLVRSVRSAIKILGTKHPGVDICSMRVIQPDCVIKCIVLVVMAKHPESSRMHRPNAAICMRAKGRQRPDGL